MESRNYMIGNSAPAKVCVAQPVIHSSAVRLATAPDAPSGLHRRHHWQAIPATTGRVSQRAHAGGGVTMRDLSP
jgi:hypothetical protein